MTLNVESMKPKAMVAAKQEISRGSVLVNNLNSAQQRSVISNGAELLRCKRKMGYVPGQPYPSGQPASVARRNARERNRVKQVNNGFATLRSHIPPAVAAALSTEKPSPRSSAANKKLSKVETLKMAVEYIRSLQQLLEDHGGSIVDKGETYDLEDNYYSSSPETVVSGENHYYPNSPDTYSKSENLDNEFYQRNYVKSENYPPHFNPEVHETLTSEFYHARSPVKAYSSPERDADDGLVTLNAMQTNHAFLQPRTHQQRNSSSLSPPMSDACPSPTPSYASDNSSLHQSSVISGSSGHLTSHLSTSSRVSSSSGQLSTQLSKLTTAPAQQPIGSRRGSPECYDNYEAMSPEDEELLDVISWWQRTN